MRSWARSLEAFAPRRGLASVLLIVALVFGVVTMHAMSGSPMSHATLPAIESMAPMTDVGHGAASTSAEPVGHTEPTGKAGARGLMAAMCLMVLVALMVLVPPRRRAWRAAGGRDGVRAWTVRSAQGPCLIELGISRT